MEYERERSEMIACQQIECQMHDRCYEDNCDHETKNGDPYSSICEDYKPLAVYQSE